MSRNDGQREPSTPDPTDRHSDRKRHVQLHSEMIISYRPRIQFQHKTEPNEMTGDYRRNYKLKPHF